jgi:hypothetical protein
LAYHEAEETTGLIEHHWDEVKLVAEALNARKKLKGAEIKAIIVAARRAQIADILTRNVVRKVGGFSILDNPAPIEADQ